MRSMRMLLSCACVVAATIMAACRPNPPQRIPLEEARQYSADAEALSRQSRFGTDWTAGADGPQRRAVAVDPGDPKDPGPYYDDLDKELGVPLKKFNQILAFFGYDGLRGDDLENLDPAVLRDPAAVVAAVPRPEFLAAVQAVPLLADDILSARFFAPKITDVAKKPEDIVFGWRKVVRLRARAKSKAADKGLVAAWLLFNVFSNGPQPFDTKSKNNQAMLIRGGGPTPLLSKPAYWLVFGSVANAEGDGDRIDFLEASFDNRHPGIVSEGKYYVPMACADCHGGLSSGQPDYAKAKLNYLDTDHWFDRTQDDFRLLDPELGVVFDGGVKTTTDAFKQSFGIIYTLNGEIKEQNTLVNGDGPKSFQLRAVEKWLDLHRDNVGFVDMFDRNITLSTGRQWTKSNAIDAQLLPLLNRYCFRCHSSLRYHVFDKDVVFTKRNLMVNRLQRPATDKVAMPQDRNLVDLAPRDRACLIQLLPHVGTNSQVSCPPQ